MKKIAILLAGIIVLVGRLAIAQQLPVSDLYEHNTFTYNPAHIGLHDRAMINLGNRYQWLGFEGAPVNISLNGFTPITNNVSLGLRVTNQRANVFETNRVDLTYAYLLKFDRESSLSIGISGGLYALRIQWQNARANDITDELVFANGDRGSMLDVSTGVEYKFENFQTGIAIPHVFATRGRLSNSQLMALQLKPQLIWYNSYTFELQKRWELTPWVMFRKAPGITQFEASLSTQWNKRLGASIGYRYQESCLFSVDALINESFKVAYSFGTPVGATIGSNAGSHEVLLSYAFAESKVRRNSRFSSLRIKHLFHKRSHGHKTKHHSKATTSGENTLKNVSLETDEKGILTNETKQQILKIVKGQKSKIEKIRIDHKGDQNLLEQVKNLLQENNIPTEKIKENKGTKAQLVVTLKG